MAEIYQEKPEVLEVGVSIDGEFIPSLYIVGRNKKEIEEAIAGALHGLASQETRVVPAKKARKARGPNRPKDMPAPIKDNIERTDTAAPSKPWG